MSPSILSRLRRRFMDPAAEIPPAPPDLGVSVARFLGADEELEILDVGSNRGETVAAWRRIFPRASITAFEPDPELAEGLGQRFQADDGVLVEPLALADEVGDARLHQFDDSAVNSLKALVDRRFLDRPVEARGHLSVSVTTLDAYLRDRGIERLDLVKVDVQGGELDLIRGAEATLRSGQVRAWVFELNFVPVYAGQAYAWELCSALRGYGYTLFDLFNQRRDSEGRLKWGDGLFIPERSG